jgi:hypothetical protein
MSQRLHVGPTDDPVYDAVIADESGVTEENLSDWLYGSPRKVRIGDVALWRKVEPALAELFPGRFPDDIWFFYMGDRKIEHPTEEELREWIAD